MRVRLEGWMGSPSSSATSNQRAVAASLSCPLPGRAWKHTESSWRTVPSSSAVTWCGLV
jgi:hypothetical protein